MPSILSIDPGIDGTGVALWNAGRFTSKRPDICPVDVQNLYPRKKGNWLESVHSLSDKVRHILRECAVEKVYCEFPQFFGSVKGRAAIVTKSRDGIPEPGDVFKLTYLVGAFGQLCHSREIEFVPILVNEWKGQLPKEIVEARLKEYIPRIEYLGVTSHGWDAVGIGYHARGFEL